MKHIPSPRTHSKQKVFTWTFYVHKWNVYLHREHTQSRKCSLNILCSLMKNMTIRQNNHVHVNILCSQMKRIPSLRTHSKQKVFTWTFYVHKWPSLRTHSKQKVFMWTFYVHKCWIGPQGKIIMFTWTYYVHKWNVYPSPRTHSKQKVFTWTFYVHKWNVYLHREHTQSRKCSR